MSTILYPFGPWCDNETSGDTTLYPFGAWWVAEEEGIAAIGYASAGHATALGHASVSIPASGAGVGQNAQSLGASAVEVAAVGAAQAGLAAAIGAGSPTIAASGAVAGGLGLADGQSTLSIAASGQASAGWSLAVSEVMVGVPAVGAAGAATAGHAAVASRASLEAGVAGEMQGGLGCSLALGGISFSGLGYASAGYAWAAGAGSVEGEELRFGYDETGELNRSYAAGFLYAQGPYIVPVRARITALRMSITAIGSPPGQGTFGLYADADGAPGELVAVLGAHTVAGTGWQEMACDETIPAGTYWIAAHAAETIYVRADDPGEAEVTTRYVAAEYTGGTLVDPFPAGAASVTRDFSIYCVYEETAVTAIPSIEAITNGLDSRFGRSNGLNVGEIGPSIQ